MISDRTFAASGLPVSRIGLGCSRLGSVLGASIEESESLLRHALDQGITFFDTSDIYAQGDSERLLGRVMGRRDDVLICTKVGKYLPPLKRMLVPVKTLIRDFARNSQSVTRGVRNSRAKPMPTNWAPDYIAKAVDRSLQRLGRDCLDVLMLHSPPQELIAEGAAIAALERARDAGKIRIIGVSVDTPAAALAALDFPAVAALQVPLHPDDVAFEAALDRARAKGVAIVAREVLGGPNVINKAMLGRDAVQTRLRSVSSIPGVTLALVGTTKLAHLQEAVDAFA